MAIVSVPLPKFCHVSTDLFGATILRVVPAPVTVTPAVVCRFVGVMLGIANTLVTVTTNTIIEAKSFTSSELFRVLLYFIYYYLVFVFRRLNR